MGYMYDGLYGIDGLYVGLCGRTRRRLRGSRTFNTTQLSFTDIISHLAANSFMSILAKTTQN